MPTVNVDTELQKFLTDTHLYDGPIDGKISKDVYDAIDKLLDTYKIEDSGWKPQRRYIAAKQILFYANKIKSGEIVALMGRNGAGKSSLIKALLDVIKYEGKITKRFVKIGYIPQDANDLLYHQSVAAECAQTDKDHGLRSGTTFQLLAKISPKFNQIKESVHPRDLSEGQRLALVLAIVLAPNPELLLLDEPTRGLD